MTDDDTIGPSGLPSIFDVFEPPPDVDPNRFGPVPIVGADDIYVDAGGAGDEIDDGDDIEIVDDFDPGATEPGSELPHWTAPPTGTVPAVVGSGEGRSELRGPRWKGEGPDWADDDLEEVFGDDDAFGGDAFGDDPFDGESSSSNRPVVVITDDEELEAAIPPAAGAPQRTPRPRHRPAPPSGERNMTQAVLMGIALGAGALAAFYFGGNLVALALITLVAALAAAEFFRAMRVSGTSPASLLGVVASAAFPPMVYHRGEPGYVLMVGLVVVFGALWYIVGADSHKPALNLGLTFLGTFWIGGMAAFASLLLLIEDGKSIIVAAVAITVASDTAALGIGKAIGKTPFHSASPNKTWEGTIGGFIAAVATGLILGIFEISPFSGSLTDAALLGVVGGLFAPLGDLTESMIKRDLGVKDMGTLLPGHGGVMDRIDGLLFVLPAAYYLTLLLGLDHAGAINTLIGQ